MRSKIEDDDKKMRRYLTRKALFLLVLSVSFLWIRWRPAERFSPSPVRPSCLRVMTWNVGYFALTPNKNMRDVDVSVVVEVIRECAVQIVTLQELGSMEQAQAIAAQLGEGWTVCAVPTGHADQVVATLTQLSLVARDEVLCADRMAQGVSLRDANQNEIYFLGVHAPHPVRGVQLNYDCIATAIDHVAERQERIKIVAGDFNYDFEWREDDPLHAHALQEFADGTADMGRTYYAHTRIDHLLHAPQQMQSVPAESGVVDLKFRWAPVPGARDHRPIVVTYELP